MKFSKKISLDQSSLPFGRVGQHGILAYALPWERRLVGGMTLSFVCLCALYAYFVITSIFHVAAMQDLIGQVSTAKTAVSRLETQYFAKSDTITESYALSLGYVSAPPQAFVTRESVTALNTTH